MESIIDFQNHLNSLSHLSYTLFMASQVYSYDFLLFAFIWLS